MSSGQNSYDPRVMFYVFINQFYIFFEDRGCEANYTTILRNKRPKSQITNSKLFKIKLKMVT